MDKKEKTKPTKKKILMYYLILAACLLVIAGVTVGVIFAVRANNSTVTPPVIDNNDDNNHGENKPNEDDNGGNKPSDPDTPDKPTNTTQYEFIAPVKEINLSQAHVFAHDKTLDRYCLHEGMDFKCAAGTEVLAAVDGTVTNVSYRDELYGAVIEIEHADGVKTVYRFIDPAESIKKGDKVSRGDVIGTVATATGVENAEGDHLHFEVYKNNIMQDPDDYLNIISK